MAYFVASYTKFLGDTNYICRVSRHLINSLQLALYFSLFKTLTPLTMKRLKFLLTAFLTAIFTITVITACNSGTPTADSTASGKTVTMATSADYPPYEFIDTSSGSQEIVGFDVDIAKYITEKLGYTLKIDNIDFNGLIPALQSKRADFVMAGMTPTAERKKNVDFSQIYYDAKNTIVAKKDSGFTSAASLSGKKLGVQLGSIQEEAAKKFTGVNVQPLNRINEMIQELKAGRIDAILMEDTVAAGYLKSNPDLAANVIPNEGDSGSAIAFPKGSAMLAEFDPILTELKSSGKLEEFITKWFGDKPA